MEGQFYEQINISDLSSKINNITDDTDGFEKISNYIQSNSNVMALEDFDFVPENSIQPSLSLVTPNLTHSINIKESALFILALLVDINITKGALLPIMGMTGITHQTIFKLADEQKCIIIDIKQKKSNTLNSMNKVNKECCQNNLKCRHRDGNICNRSIDDISRELGELEKKKIIICNNGKYKIAF